MATKVTKISAKFITSLAQKVAIGATTGTLVSIADLDGVNLPSGRYGFTIDEGNSSVEYIEADLSGTAISGVKGINPTSLAETTGFVKEHRAGAEVKITDFTVLARIRALITGETSLDGASPLTYDASPSLSNPLSLATVEYVLSIVSGGAVTFNANVIAGMAGESISSGDWVYFKESDGRWYKTSAAATATSRNVRIGKALGAGTVGAGISGGVFIGGIETVGTYVAGTSYYLSDTAGALATSAGTERVLVGIGDGNSDLIFMSVYDPEAVTYNEKQAMTGSSGTPSSTNKFVTQDSQSAVDTDQSQTTQNATVETGEADATSKKNLIAQSFIPAKTKIRGVKLYKAADTGTFTGDVVITLQADSSGSPSGTPLATATLTNLQWLGFSTGEFEALFASEYTSLVSGTTYWIVIDPSTSDNSNHPNLGTNSAGGYSSGSVKYKNTTDSWVAVATIDLYFKTLEGTTAQSVKTDSSGKIPVTFFDVTKMPLPAYSQILPFTNPSDTGGTIRGFASNQDGSVFIAIGSIGGVMVRYQRDTKTGYYFQTHSAGFTGGGSLHVGAVILGLYLYVFYDAGTNIGCQRYDAADLTNSTAITISTPIVASGTGGAGAWTDGRYLYVISDDAGTTVVVLSISGTTATQVTTATSYEDFNVSNSSTFCALFDGINILLGDQNSTNTDKKIRKLSAKDGSAGTTTTFRLARFSDTDDTGNNLGLVNIDTDRLYLVRSVISYDEAGAVSYNLYLIPRIKP